MDYTKTMQALRRLKVETGSLACLGCGYEHDCSTKGCAIIRNAVEHMEAALSNYDHLSALVDKQGAEIKVWAKDLAASEAARAELGQRLAAAQKLNAELTDAQAVMVEEFDRKLEELHEAKSELDAAVRGQETLQKALAAYKDTGLTADEIREVQDVMKPIPFGRFRDIMEAERAGRLVVLDEPRKPLVWGDDNHDTILCPACGHDLMGGFQEADSCETTMYQCPYCGQPIDGSKAIHREEAALEERECPK